ncbi:hypothetical protein V1478_015116 [Vespula squamosa]|uniref:Uncharacterized protein n=1 Tax=Vespula squamosa TaxID=30214 RepID=A0ABD2A465_VESSQ
MNHVSPFLTVVDSSPFVGADNKLCASRPVNSGYIMSTTRYVRRSNYVTDTVVVGPLDPTIFYSSYRSLEFLRIQSQLKEEI